MPMSVISQFRPTGNNAYYTPEFRHNLELHLDYLRLNAPMTPMTISEQLAYKYEGDLYGAMTELGIRSHMQWIVMRLNGFTSPTQLKSAAGTIMVPEEAVITRLLNMLNTKK